ncbi:MAG TPA: hypothetical protein VN776_10105 [Terracidiphilus sp.]|nr:hypothetical protein [Terracidiphilus sp.]
MRASYAGWLLPLFLTACFPFHKAHQQLAPPLAPPSDSVPKPTTTHPDLPASALVIPSQPIKTDTDATIEKPAKQPAKHRRPPKTTQQAAVTPPAAAENPGVSAIGQLTSGERSDVRREAEESMAATERGLNGISRTLSDQEKKTAAQIREFLKQAREALISGDVDGASTLAAKAKVLLSELSQ